MNHDDERDLVEEAVNRAQVEQEREAEWLTTLQPWQRRIVERIGSGERAVILMPRVFT